MSADMWVESPTCDKCGRGPEESNELNITYNLSAMLVEAGFIGWRNVLDMDAKVVGRHVLGVLNGMADNPEKWRAKNPSNGWGDFDKCIQIRMRAWAENCLEAPDGSKVDGSL